MSRRAGSSTAFFVALALLSPDAGTWRVEVGSSGAPTRPISDVFALERRTGLASDVLAGWVVDRYDIHGISAGRWSMRIVATDLPVLMVRYSDLMDGRTAQVYRRGEWCCLVWR